LGQKHEPTCTSRWPRTFPGLGRHFGDCETDCAGQRLLASVLGRPMGATLSEVAEAVLTQVNAIKTDVGGMNDAVEGTSRLFAEASDQLRQVVANQPPPVPGDGAGPLLLSEGM